MIDAAAGEQTHISGLIQRLTQTYPTVAPATVEQVVRDMYMRFDGAPVREFVPLLVERYAHTALAELSVSYA
jgi:hypothetical protein